jgi:hypothetical protein
MKQQALRAQRGITLIGFIMVLAVAGIFVFLGMRFVPVYIEYYSVLKDIKAACKEPDAPAASLAQMRAKLDRRFFVSYIESVNLNKDIKIIREGDSKLLNVAYQVRRPLIYNIEFIATFEHSEPMVGGGAASE